MTPAVEALFWGLPPTLTLCTCVYIQRRANLRPPRDAKQAQTRETIRMMMPLAHFGVRMDRDRFIYGPSGRCLGPLDGATARLEPAVKVTSPKASTGWAVITFADGTEHRWRYPLRRQLEAEAELARFQSYAATTPAGAFARTRPAHMAP